MAVLVDFNKQLNSDYTNNILMIARNGVLSLIKIVLHNDVNSYKMPGLYNCDLECNTDEVTMHGK